MCLWGRGSPPAHHSPSSFFFPPLLAATEPCSPPASPPLACCTPCSTLDPAPANRMGMSGSQWGNGGRRGGPCPRSSGFYLCRHNKRGRREKEKKPQRCSCQCICFGLQLFLSSSERFMGSSCSLSLLHCQSPQWQKVRMHRRERCLWINAAGHKVEGEQKCAARETELCSM